jgi:hypothetical protein
MASRVKAVLVMKGVGMASALLGTQTQYLAGEEKTRKNKLKWG